MGLGGVNRRPAEAEVWRELWVELRRVESETILFHFNDRFFYIDAPITATDSWRYDHLRRY